MLICSTKETKQENKKTPDIMSDKFKNHSRQSSSPVIISKWETYTQTLLEKGAVSGFGVYSTSNFHKWTGTPGFCAGPEQLCRIVSGFNDELPLRIQGIQINDVTFTFTRLGLNRRLMVGRCTASGAGCVLYLCQTCILVATCEPQQSSLCFTTIEKLGDFLITKNF
ncbi:profilin [Plakobranchus ocellatus]|uniref:Profilin n=1 Tax=Plakobranchus ocellatus TaxID=259542 RepID=A0AAV4D9X6_9GAST|nr:profilin [Plakobranchus ocellatus]